MDRYREDGEGGYCHPILPYNNRDGEQINFLPVTEITVQEKPRREIIDGDLRGRLWWSGFNWGIRWAWVAVFLGLALLTNALVHFLIR